MKAQVLKAGISLTQGMIPYFHVVQGRAVCRASLKEGSVDDPQGGISIDE